MPLVLRQPFVIDTLVTTILAQATTFTVLVKILHYLFKILLCFHNYELFKIRDKGSTSIG